MIFLFEILKRFNFGDEFIKWVRLFYTGRKSYVINNGFLTDEITIHRGIFQGCPISPFLFLFVIEAAARAIRRNENIYGIFFFENYELKLSLLADDTTCFFRWF